MSKKNNEMPAPIAGTSSEPTTSLAALTPSIDNYVGEAAFGQPGIRNESTLNQTPANIMIRADSTGAMVLLMGPSPPESTIRASDITSATGHMELQTQQTATAHIQQIIPTAHFQQQQQLYYQTFSIRQLQQQQSFLPLSQQLYHQTLSIVQLQQQQQSFLPPPSYLHHQLHPFLELPAINPLLQQQQSESLDNSVPLQQRVNATLANNSSDQQSIELEKANSENAPKKFQFPAPKEIRICAWCEENERYKESILFKDEVFQHKCFKSKYHYYEEDVNCRVYPVDGSHTLYRSPEYMRAHCSYHHGGVYPWEGGESYPDSE